MKLSSLKQFEQFSQLSDDQLIILSKHLKTYTCKAKGDIVLPLGSNSPYEFFLLQGSLQLTAEDGMHKEIKAGSDDARLSVARLRPSFYEVSALQPSRLLVIHNETLKDIVAKTRNAQSKPTQASHILLTKLQEDLTSNQFRLPSLPKVALKVRELINTGEAHVAEVEQVLNTDPSIVTKLIRTANSPIYRRGHACNGCHDAVMRLGLATTKQLVMSFSLKQLFKARHKETRLAMQESWRKSVQVGTLCQLLAQRANMNPETALLVGLLHNIGELPVLMYLDQLEEIPADMAILLKDLNIPMAVEVLQHWEFEPLVIDAIAQGCQWFASDVQAAVDYRDVLIVAKLHSVIGSNEQFQYPRMDEVPAFRKLALEGSMTPELSLQLIQESQEQLDEMFHMLGI
ncbi:HD-like signal output (HDOD) domain, no enzymatic activity [Allopseudospirillum japonicum]|uniref:HD-like signal output (HDOD) domain, no enzymatic activity n=1 Tax=Allopseudospirillum japonicum TaxID=64971 RepID=A0A1H6QCY9_9GAMM|nr:HDOD domain-containing protein [Allopseudospirillum japonicum]SEI39716.1 HD-like signal output (HDOD) domain, no enzymatic activity [Allopseudospirillum japonicum]